MQNKLNEIIELLEKEDNFLIAGHVGADGDCIGSVTALTRILNKKNKTARAYLNKESLAPFAFLEINESCFFTETESLAVELKNQDYILLVLDCGSRDRVDLPEELFNAAQYVINIDHHEDNSLFAKYNFVDSKRAAVGEIIYLIAEKLISTLPQNIARSIATAIITDTGALRYENTTPQVMRILAKLMESGVSIYRINKAIFGSISYPALLLKSKALATLKRSENKKVAWLYVSREMIHEAGTDYTEGLVGLARDIEGVEVGILFTEEESHQIKISFRSNFYVAVNKIAAQFGGGGHPRAAGATVQQELNTTIESVVKEALKHV
ncbi:DHH family phosphoesterase [Halanaerobium salsuginis]|jgi:phosphoesterase RecJ-like protein|uniref:Phosphoesterase RecJ domain-containing protein n=1 Tax=Halanaerobium salsuginis TaxID=29563 RepID=A0A1I4F8A7_9FIRM|nr:bifunctional oligoribonuclease/PAP phosphatase NrnA [Halanaerobium salsuginis]SFL14212.1 phosphoesterase RecJ domain-containing protein [Halanaerobium salsuginis]